MLDNKSKNFAILVFLVILVTIMLRGQNSLPFLVPLVFAHCDTMGGPVIQAEGKALETGKLQPVLMWVQEKDEAQIKEAFEKTLAVRKLSPEAKKLADMYFFETLVRIHRAGEAAPYTGLKADETVSTIVMAADQALESGSVDNLVKEVSRTIAVGIRERFNRVMEKKKYIDESIEAGREYVKAYVEYVHYVENLHIDASGQSTHHEGTEARETEGHHKH